LSVIRENVPRKYRKLYDRATNATSRKAKIRFFCLECCGFEGKEVHLCSDTDCIFYKIRESG